jgi:hypothetical protein
MSEFDTYSCENCGESFTAHPSAQAVETSYCSPQCHTASEGLA